LRLSKEIMQELSDAEAAQQKYHTLSDVWNDNSLAN
jgi:hypothetical protein